MDLINSNPSLSAIWAAHALRITGSGHNVLTTLEQVRFASGTSNSVDIESIAVPEGDTLIIRLACIDNISGTQSKIEGSSDFSGSVEVYTQYTGESGDNNGMSMVVASEAGPSSAAVVPSQSWDINLNEEHVWGKLVIFHDVEGALPEHGLLRRFVNYRPLVRSAIHREIMTVHVSQAN